MRYSANKKASRRRWRQRRRQQDPHHKQYVPLPFDSEGPGIWFSVWKFLLIHCLYERAAKVLARLRECAGSPEPSLLA